jgi:hypothetical protein
MISVKKKNGTTKELQMFSRKTTCFLKKEFCNAENQLTSSFRIAASAFACCKFSHAVILASSLCNLHNC